MNSVYSTSLAAMTAAQATVAQAARTVANPRADETGVIEAMIAIKQAEATHSAAATIARTAAEMEDRVLDILA